MKILIFDIETAPIVSTHWGLFGQDILYENILQDWYIISIAWKWLDKKKIHTCSVLDNGVLNDDSGVVAHFYDVLQEADAIVAHNGDKFDIKKFNARAIVHGLTPLPPIPSVDTLKLARRHFKFTSNRLDYLGDYLGVGRKVETPKGLWKRALHVPGLKEGEPDAISAMVKYNKADITLLEDVYLKLRPYDTTHANWNHHYEDVCPSCGSADLEKRGYSRTRLTTKQRYRCNECGSWSTGREVLDSVTIR